jgi:hypothetical protein
MMPNGGDGKKKSLSEAQKWNLYGKLRQAHRDGASLEELDRSVRQGAGMSLQELQDELQIGQTDRPLSRGERFKGSMREIGQGITFGWGDEIAGKIAGVAEGGLDEAGYRAKFEADRAPFREQYPGASLLGNVAGGALPMIPLMGLTGGGAAGMAGPGLLEQSIMGGALGALGGAGGAALAGAGEAGPGQRLQGAGQGAAVGGAFGGALGAVAPGVGAAAYRYAPALMEAAPGQATTRAAARMRRANPAARNMALSEIDQAMDRANVARTPEELAQRMSRDLTPEGVVADLDQSLGTQAASAAARDRMLARVNGPVRRVAERYKGAGGRISRATREAADMPLRRLNPDEVAQAKIEVWRESVRNPVLRQHGDDAVGSTVFGRVAKDNPIIMEILPQVRGVELAANPAHQKLTVQQAWNLRRRLARLKDASYKGNTETGLRYDPDELIAALDDFDKAAEGMHPGLERMRGSFHEIKVEQRARTAGKKAISKPGDEIRAALEKLSPEEQAFYREGMMDALEDKLIKRSTGQGTAKGMLDLDGDDLQKLRYMFPDLESFQNLVRFLEQEGAMQYTSQAMERAIRNPMAPEQAMRVGYLTTRRALANELLSAALEDPNVGQVAAGHVGEFLLSGPEEGPARLAALQGAQRDATAIRGMRSRTGGLLGERLMEIEKDDDEGAGGALLPVPATSRQFRR